MYAAKFRCWKEVAREAVAGKELSDELRKFLSAAFLGEVLKRNENLNL